MKREWYYATNGTKFGPVTAGELRILANEGKLSSSDLVWKEGMADWKPAREIKGLIPSKSDSTGVATPSSDQAGQTANPVPTATSTLRSGWGIYFAAIVLLGIVTSVGITQILMPRQQRPEAAHQPPPAADHAPHSDDVAEQVPSLTTEDSVEPNQRPRRVKYAIQKGKTVWVLDQLLVSNCGKKNEDSLQDATYLIWDGSTLEGIETKQIDTIGNTGVRSSWTPTRRTKNRDLETFVDYEIKHVDGESEGVVVVSFEMNIDSTTLQSRNVARIEINNWPGNTRRNFGWGISGTSQNQIMKNGKPDLFPNGREMPKVRSTNQHNGVGRVLSPVKAEDARVDGRLAKPKDLPQEPKPKEEPGAGIVPADIPATKLPEETQKDRAIYLAGVLSSLKFRRDDVSVTQLFTKGKFKVEMRGPGYREFVQAVDRKDWLAAFNKLTSKDWAELQAISEINEALSRVGISVSQDIKIPTGPALEGQSGPGAAQVLPGSSTPSSQSKDGQTPFLIFVDKRGADLKAIKARQDWKMLIVKFTPLTRKAGSGDTVNYGFPIVEVFDDWDLHPDGIGWTRPWNPTWANVIVAIGSPEALEGIVSSTRKQLQSLLDSLVAKQKLGEIEPADVEKPIRDLYEQKQGELREFLLKGK